MIRVFIGSIAAAVAMFVIGFVFYATPLANIHVGGLGDEEAAAIQSVLAANMDASGADTVLVPYPDGEAQQRMYIDGPIAMIHYNPSGFALGDSGSLVGGFVHMLITAFLLGGALYSLAGHVRDFGARLSIIILFGIAASVFMHAGTPIWYHQDWTYHIYVAIADAVIFIAGGAVIAKWFLPNRIDSDDRFGEEKA
ncbi:hypothetical protein [Parasphingopyxis marina]|uniref:Uncharacterized protein n=1 Tax=Parasphingopyxis marina TaxID=2761622 RepID=A0A842HVG8_9SPHN|nr:hypothetical protein [Parasphingopyxis marina]MBC2776427.1 hypothetical protein [Parasphingopyxis marina]